MTDEPQRRWNSTFRVKPSSKPQKARKPLKRSGKLKPVSKKPRRGKDSTVIEAYIRDNPSCELIEILHERGGYQWRQILGGWNERIELEVHHVAIGANSRRDVLTNLIRLTPVLHRGWGHSNFPNDLFVLSCWRKATKGELDLAVMGDIMRKPDMLGYIEVLPVQNAFVEEYRLELLDMMG